MGASVIEDYSFSSLKIFFLPLSWRGAKRKVGGEWRKGLYVHQGLVQNPVFSFFLPWLLSKFLNTNGRFCPRLRLWLPTALVVTLSSLTSTSNPSIDSVEFSTLYNNQQYSALRNAAASLAFKEENTVAGRLYAGEEASRLLIRVNVQLFRCIIKHHATKAYFRVKVHLHRFLKSAWGEEEWSKSRPYHFTQEGKLPPFSYRVGWVDRRGGLGPLEKRKISWPYPESNCSSSLVEAVHLLHEHKIGH